MTLLRTFIAVELPETVRMHLVRLGQVMAQNWAPRSVRWAAATHMHLTLRFLGDTPPESLPGLSRDLDEAASRTAGFELSLSSSGCFPNPRRARVIWVGITDAGGRLAELQQAVEEVVCARGWEREIRPFSPHLTLGRVRDRAPVPSGSWLTDPEPLPLPVRHIHLMESRLKPSGAEYRPLHTAALAGC